MAQFNRLFTPFILFFFITTQGVAQSTYDEVYTILQNNCATSGCHNHATQEAGLDLEGSGSSKMADVYGNLIDVTPKNSKAAAKHNKLIYPGHPYKSFLFRKLQHNSGLAPNSYLVSGEGDPMPPNVPMLSNEKLELIRQWILHGAPETGSPVDTGVIADYYNNGGVNSLSKTPAPPADGEGYQIHLGPYLLPPGGEKEYFLKYHTDQEVTKEIERVDTYMGDYSHHFILFRYRDGEEGAKSRGLRQDNAHTNTTIVTANQFSDSLKLPYGTAFQWDASTILDLNSHYINYNNNKPTACEVYLNVYTEPKGTAEQVMKSRLVPNFDIEIPNDGQEHTIQDAVYDSNLPIDLHIWALSSHTHQWGTDYNIYDRNADGSKGDQIFDAGCQPDGVPGCTTENYDYQHPPIREFEYPFHKMNLGEGVIHEATWVNNGPDTVRWGATSEDEMMLFFFFYVTSTEGLEPPDDTTANDTTTDDTTTTNLKQHQSPTDFSLNIYPNPSSGPFTIAYNLPEAGNTTIEILDIQGKKVSTILNQTHAPGMHEVQLSELDLEKGMYLISIQHNDKEQIKKYVKM